MKSEKFRKIKTVSFCFAALFLILTAGENTFACKCADPLTVEQSFEQSAAVFYGTVESVETSGDRILAEIRVEKSWKGATRDLVTVRTDRTSCGIDFRKGETHYLFVDREGDVYYTVPCRRHAGSQEEFLRDKSTLTLKKAPRSFIGGGNLLLAAVLVTAGIFILVIAAIFVIKRKKA